MKLLRDFSLRDKRALLRSDLNVPQDAKGDITDDFRIVKAVPTIAYLLEQGAKVMVMSHVGEPGGKRVESLALGKVGEKLQEYLACPITKARDCVGKDIEDWTLHMEPGEVLLLENLRFHQEEEENDRGFSSSLSRLGDVYINDAFSASHRKHASIVGVPEFLPSAAGLLLEDEVATLTKLVSNPPRPYLIIVGGKKAGDKLSFIDAISELADVVLLGNLLAAEHKTLFRNPSKIAMPLDGEFDIGPKTLALFVRYIQGAKSIFWAGPLGQIEKEEYAKGSLAIAEAIGKTQAFSVAGGGDLVGFLRSQGLQDNFSYLSAGGGAALAFLGGGKLPGLQALRYYGN